MSDCFVLTITVKEIKVTEGDVTDMAQRIWDELALDLDAKLGDFDIGIAYKSTSLI